MNEKQQQIFLDEIATDKNRLELEIKIIEEKLKVQKEHLKTLIYVLDNFNEDLSVSKKLLPTIKAC